MEIYVVKSGDTLYAVARRYSVTVEELVYANQLADPAVLSVGQALVIPQGQRAHTVRRGQTMYSIAQSYGVSLQRLLAANPSIDPNRIYPGQSIVIPAAGQDLGEIVVNGYITDGTDSTLSAQLPYLTFLSPFPYRTDMAGSLTQTFNVNTGLSEGERTANLMTITNLKAQGGFSSDAAHAILTDQTVQNDFLDNLEAKLAQGGWYGVNIDFEYIYQFDRESYNQFLARLTERMHALGYLVTTALAPKLSDSQQGLLYAAHDYAFHGQTVDYVVLMTYEWGYTYGPAMAVAPIDKVRQILDYAVSVMPSRKILLGVPNYGYDWTLPFVQGSAARGLTNVGAVTLAEQVGAAIQFDQTAQSPFFLYTDSGGSQHEVWFEDARSLQAKYALVSEYGLAGVSFWSLNSLFRTSFLVLESMYSVEKVV
ncbi:MAG: LysM peptidoglycan-binding domain-containing protein [Oscillospiraceae bacterium]|nr:LysM peptidoglycan-binding domain-containing protein [Oscillospiraceae bacterium]